jgi:hypothetical protein
VPSARSVQAEARYPADDRRTDSHTDLDIACLPMDSLIAGTTVPAGPSHRKQCIFKFFDAAHSVEALRRLPSSMTIGGTIKTTPARDVVLPYRAAQVRTIEQAAAPAAGENLPCHLYST